MADVVISVKHLRKTFILPHEGQNSFKGKLINFRKRGYEKQVALADVSFDVHKGDFFGIVGRNGSGKSTLLKLLAGIYTPDKGTIDVQGKLTPFIELGVGFNPELSGRDNVFLNGALLGFTREEMTGMYDEIVAFAELERFMDQKLKNYSSGMQVRLAFSIAIRANTDILVLDEVLAVGDENFQRKCFEYFKQLKRDNKTVILVTHDMGSVKKFCNRAILLENGKLIANGSPDEITNKYTLGNLEKLEEGGDKKTSASKNEPWIRITPTSKLVLKSSQSFECEVSYFVPDNTPVSFGVSLIDEATNRSTSVLNDGMYKNDGSWRITSKTKGLHTFKYTLPLDGLNNRNFEMTASLFRYDDMIDDFIPYAFTEEKDIPHFVIRGEAHDSGLLKKKGTWRRD